MVSSKDLETGEGSMVSWSLMQILTFYLDIFTILGVTIRGKNLEIFVLRQQVRFLQCEVKSLPVISDPERILLSRDPLLPPWLLLQLLPETSALNSARPTRLKRVFVLPAGRSFLKNRPDLW